MPKCVIDGREAEFQPGQNLIEVAASVGIEIPFFCYHPGLSVVAQCRMCAIEVEKAPKLLTACSTVATEGMVVKTRSPEVIRNQKSTMEFLLINHPLDCPICDKSGECTLQDHSYHYGSAFSRYTEERRSYVDLDMGPVIQKNMNRCIHCTRCIRFGEEIAHMHEMVALQRGNNTEISTIDGKSLETDYAGNYSDICPTGSLTLKDFRFKKRVWFLKDTPTVCEGCSRGCNMILQQDNNIIYRATPRVNLEINRYWLCDEGRFNFHYVNAEERVIRPAIQSLPERVWSDVSWTLAIERMKSLLQGRKLEILVGSDHTQEEGALILEFFAQSDPEALISHFGTPGIQSAQEDAPLDSILRRKSKTGNLHGLEALGFQGFREVHSSSEVILLLRAGRAVLPELPSHIPQIGIGVFQASERERFCVVLPGLSYAEKDGTIVNFEGRAQKIQRSILPRGQSRSLSEIFSLWRHGQVERKTQSVYELAALVNDGHPGAA